MDVVLQTLFLRYFAVTALCEILRDFMRIDHVVHRRQSTGFGADDVDGKDHRQGMRPAKRDPK